jgi:O-acetyl-ADP-ribose deacetylase (regulator of RNase III)
VEILYEIGDATRPIGEGAKVIAHVCNDAGGWGKGFVLALSKRWPAPEVAYRRWHRERGPEPFELGQVQFVGVEPTIWVANLIGQHGTRPAKGLPPVRYDAIRSGLRKVAVFARDHAASVHMPRIGAGLAGGSWDAIAGIVAQEIVNLSIPVTVYDLQR